MDKPMRAERNDSGDVIYYHILCPKCKHYNRLHAISTDILAGDKPFWCNSDICRLTTQLKIINGWAMEVNRPARPDLGQEKPKPTFESVSLKAYTNQRKYMN